jgi:hypothetical protein
MNDNQEYSQFYKYDTLFINDVSKKEELIDKFLKNFNLKDDIKKDLKNVQDLTEFGFNYELLNCIGFGTYGVIYKVKPILQRQFIADKELKKIFEDLKLACKFLFVEETRKKMCGYDTELYELIINLELNNTLMLKKNMFKEFGIVKLLDYSIINSSLYDIFLKIPNSDNKKEEILENMNKNIREEDQQINEFTKKECMIMVNELALGSGGDYLEDNRSQFLTEPKYFLNFILQYLCNHIQLEDLVKFTSYDNHIDNFLVSELEVNTNNENYLSWSLYGLNIIIPFLEDTRTAIFKFSDFGYSYINVFDAVDSQTILNLIQNERKKKSRAFNPKEFWNEHHSYQSMIEQTENNQQVDTLGYNPIADNHRLAISLLSEITDIYKRTALGKDEYTKLKYIPHHKVLEIIYYMIWDSWNNDDLHEIFTIIKTSLSVCFNGMKKFDKELLKNDPFYEQKFKKKGFEENLDKEYDQRKIYLFEIFFYTFINYYNIHVFEDKSINIKFEIPDPSVYNKEIQSKTYKENGKPITKNYMTGSALSVLLKIKKIVPEYFHDSKSSIIPEDQIYHMDIPAFHNKIHYKAETMVTSKYNIFKNSQQFKNSFHEIDLSVKTKEGHTKVLISKEDPNQVFSFIPGETISKISNPSKFLKKNKINIF